MTVLKKVNLNGRNYEIHYFTGTVVDEKKWSETEVSGSGGGGGGYTVGGTGFNSPGFVDVRSSTRQYDQIILQNREGDEQSFRFQDWGIACRTGNVLTVLWAIAKNRKWGPYILAYNHESRDCFMDDELPNMLSPGRVTLPVTGWRLSLLPLAAIPAVPFAFYALWAIIVGQDSALFAAGMLASPFVGFYGTRKIVRNIGQKRADEYIEADPDGLMRALKETRDQASPAKA